MSEHLFPRRFALLIGIDAYQEGDVRKLENGDPIHLRNLAGCVNDIQAIKAHIKEKFGLDCPCIMISADSLDSKSSAENHKPLPTFNNIKTYFNKVTSEARAGDFFYFHFSGHGARLRKTEKSPQDGRSEDPSLMTVDFCSGGPALRGWQLNAWLKNLHENGVQVVVSLDSCYSDGAWRNDGRLRTPDGWTPPPNLPVDEEAAQETVSGPIYRDSKLDVSWGINPSRFTLMAACKSDEGAAEISVRGTTYGGFTYEMLRYLKEIWPRVATYYTLRDQIARQLERQTPQVHGRGQLVFFGNSEPFLSSPLVCEFEGSKVLIPAGKFHGIEKGAQFTTSFCSPPITITVDWVDAFSCGTTVLSDVLSKLELNNEVTLSRWSLGVDRLKIIIDSRFESEFPKLLRLRLEDGIFGDLEICQEDNLSTKTADFRLARRDEDGVEVFGPISVTGYEDPVRGLHIGGKTLKEKVMKSALTLAHLARFNRILNLRDKASQEYKPFVVTLEPLEGSDKAIFRHNKQLWYTFKNSSNSLLYWAIISLSPGFGIKQIYPKNSEQETIQPERSKSIKFRMTVPEQLRNGTPDEVQWAHRDIIRTVVSKSRLSSLRGLEMSDVWDTEQIIPETRQDSERDAKLKPRTILGSDSDLWIKDVEVFTTIQKDLDSD